MKDKLFCVCCKATKATTEFGKKSTSDTGYQPQCNVCKTKQTSKYLKTKKGLITKLYGHQRCHSKTRGHPMPTYTNKELYAWLMAQEDFHHLHHLWKLSNYDTWLRPSVDRIDDDLPYSFSNIQLMTWRENQDKWYNKCRQKNKG